MKCNKDILNRVKRAGGQISGVFKMMEEERDCEEIITQLSAVRSSIDKTISLIASYNLIGEIESNYNIEIKNVDRALELLVKNK